jgi:hypothetical protein
MCPRATCYLRIVWRWPRRLQWSGCSHLIWSRNDCWYLPEKSITVVIQTTEKCEVQVLEIRLYARKVRIFNPHADFYEDWYMLWANRSHPKATLWFSAISRTNMVDAKFWGRNDANVLTLRSRNCRVGSFWVKSFEHLLFTARHFVNCKLMGVFFCMGVKSEF